MRTAGLMLDAHFITKDSYSKVKGAALIGLVLTLVQASLPSLLWRTGQSSQLLSSASLVLCRSCLESARALLIAPVVCALAHALLVSMHALVHSKHRIARASARDGNRANFERFLSLHEKTSKQSNARILYSVHSAKQSRKPDGGSAKESRARAKQ